MIIVLEDVQEHTEVKAPLAALDDVDLGFKDDTQGEKGRAKQNVREANPPANGSAAASKVTVQIGKGHRQRVVNTGNVGSRSAQAEEDQGLSHGSRKMGENGSKTEKQDSRENRAVEGDQEIKRKTSVMTMHANSPQRVVKTSKVVDSSANGEVLVQNGQRTATVKVQERPYNFVHNVASGAAGMRYCIQK